MSRKHCLGEKADPPESVVQLLRRPSSYPERPRHVEVRETHISWVFLTDTRAYKLKKPVRFDFLDFSTPQLRRQACEDELRLNRRLARDVYREVLPITVDRSGRVALDGDGDQIDWVVQMCRLPDESSLDRMIAGARVSPRDVDQIAVRLSRFYQDLPPVPLKPDVYRQEIDGHLRANRHTLLDAPDHFQDTVVKRVHTAQLRFLHAFPQVFDKRVREGRIVEGHGDLRPEHIYLTASPVIIDCVEFNREFRQLDVLDELCFLAMECAHLGADWIGEQIIEHYLKASGDRLPSDLRAFYMSYRCCVRAKVQRLRASQLPATGNTSALHEAARYLEMADQMTQQWGPPPVLIVRGPSGVGKTTLAEHLAATLGMEYLQTDAIRRELLGASCERAKYNEGRYAAANRNRVYRAMFERAERLISSGLGVILDGAFLTRVLQCDAVNMAIRLGARPVLINCTCPPETAAQRITRRSRKGGSTSDADITTHRRQLQEEELPPPHLPQCQVDTTCALPTLMRTVLAAAGGESSGSQ